MVTTEERLSRVEGAYEQVDHRLENLHDDMGNIRVEMRGLRTEMNDRMTSMENRLHSILIAVIAGSASIVVTLIAGIIAFLLRTA